ncbi:MAG: DUF2148 domain-containing protein [Syntrophobacteraceae bacterium]
MAVYEGFAAANEYMVDVAKACAAAAAKAPTLTGQFDLRMEILTGEDLEPMIQVLETLGKGSAFQAHDATAFRAYKDEGILPPVLLLGADLTLPPMWNCGGCGFTSCGEYIEYVRRNKGVGIGAYGPSCLWKVIELGIAADHACACAAMHRAEARILLSMGAVSLFLGRLEGVSIILALPIGPVGQHRWFDRKTWTKHISYEQRTMTQMAGAPNLFFAFSGGGNPILKSKPRWWEDPTFMKIEQDEALMEKLTQDQADAYQKIMQFAGVLDEEE